MKYGIKIPSMRRQSFLYETYRWHVDQRRGSLVQEFDTFKDAQKFADDHWDDYHIQQIPQNLIKKVLDISLFLCYYIITQ